MTKAAKDIQPGDRLIVDASGKIVTVIRVGNGMYRGSRLIEWRGGWSCPMSGDQLVLAD
jgi:hypothetical protein